MPRYTVTNVDTTIVGETPCWMVKYEVTELLPDQQPVHYYIFPKFAVAQRIAEYELDPNDVDTALDILLGEDGLNSTEVPALLTAETVEVARVNHVRGCAERKLARRLSSRGIQNPLEIIRSSYEPDLQDLSRRRLDVQAMRTAHRHLQGKKSNRG